MSNFVQAEDEIIVFISQEANVQFTLARTGNGVVLLAVPANANGDGEFVQAEIVAIMNPTLPDDIAASYLVLLADSQVLNTGDYVKRAFAEDVSQETSGDDVA